MSVSRQDGGADDGLPDTIIWCIDGEGEGTRIAEVLPDMIIWELGEGVRVTDGDTVTDFGGF